MVVLNTFASVDSVLNKLLCGQRNYRFYLTFLVAALAFFAFNFAFCFWRIHQRLFVANTGLLGLLRNCPETVALASFSFVAIGLLGCLASYQVYLIAINQVVALTCSILISYRISWLFGSWNTTDFFSFFCTLPDIL